MLFERKKIIMLSLACSENEHDYTMIRRKYRCKLPNNSFSRFSRVSSNLFLGIIYSLHFNACRSNFLNFNYIYKKYNKIYIFK